MHHLMMSGGCEDSSTASPAQTLFSRAACTSTCRIGNWSTGEWLMLGWLPQPCLLVLSPVHWQGTDTAKSASLDRKLFHMGGGTALALTAACSAQGTRPGSCSQHAASRCTIAAVDGAYAKCLRMSPAKIQQGWRPSASSHCIRWWGSSGCWAGRAPHSGRATASSTCVATSPSPITSALRCVCAMPFAVVRLRRLLWVP